MSEVVKVANIELIEIYAQQFFNLSTQCTHNALLSAFTFVAPNIHWIWLKLFILIKATNQRICNSFSEIPLPRHFALPCVWNITFAMFQSIVKQLIIDPKYILWSSASVQQKNEQ